MPKVGVFIGRFQPFHNGHKHVIETALKEFDSVVVMIGSANQPRSARNPFTFEERSQMIKSAFRFNNEDKRIGIFPLVNCLYNDTAWINQVRQNVRDHIGADTNTEIHLVGYAKDHSSYYLNLFPDWKSFNVSPYTYWEQRTVREAYPKVLDATEIRNDLYKNYHTDWSWRRHIPIESVHVIGAISPSEIDKLIFEHKFLEDYKKQWQVAPYPVTFVTVDAVVIQAGHVLMVRRGAYPGKGLCALPGGFIGEYETIVDACVRELYEETRIDLPKPAIYGALSDFHVFDSPYRSQRGRTITHAYLFELDRSKPMPRIKGSDDAEKALWIPLDALDRKQIYEDHSDIISFFTGVRIG